VQTTADAIEKACSSGCMHAVLSVITSQYKNDTVCAYSTAAELGPMLVAVGDAVCAESQTDESHEYTNHCFIQVTKVRSQRHGWSAHDRALHIILTHADNGRAGDCTCAPSMPHASTCR
jgi:hypothetical protein